MNTGHKGSGNLRFSTFMKFISWLTLGFGLGVYTLPKQILGLMGMMLEDPE